MYGIALNALFQTVENARNTLITLEIVRIQHNKYLPTAYCWTNTRPQSALYLLYPLPLSPQQQFFCIIGDNSP